MPQAPIDVPPVSRDVPPVIERPTPALPDIPDPKEEVCRDVSESYEQIKELNRNTLRSVQNDLKDVYGSASAYLKEIYEIEELRNMPNVRKSFTIIGQFALRYTMPARLSDQDKKEFSEWKRDLLQALGYIFRASKCGN